MQAENENVVDPIKNNAIIEQQLLTKQLRDGLVLQRVNFDEDYNAWDRYNDYSSCCKCVSVCMHV